MQDSWPPEFDGILDVIRGLPQHLRRVIEEQNEAVREDARRSTETADTAVEIAADLESKVVMQDDYTQGIQTTELQLLQLWAENHLRHEWQSASRELVFLAIKNPTLADDLLRLCQKLDGIVADVARDARTIRDQESAEKWTQNISDRIQGPLKAFRISLDTEVR